MRGLDHKGPRAVQFPHAQGGDERSDGVNTPRTNTSLSGELGERIADLCACPQRLGNAREFARISLDAAVEQQRKNARIGSTSTDPIIETIEDFRSLVNAGARRIESQVQCASDGEALPVDLRERALRANPRRSQLAMSSLSLGLRRSIARAPETRDGGLDALALATIGMTVVHGGEPGAQVAPAAPSHDASSSPAAMLALSAAQAKRDRKKALRLAERNR